MAMMIEILFIVVGVVVASGAYVLIAKRETYFCRVLEVGEFLSSDTRSFRVKVEGGSVCMSQFVSYWRGKKKKRVQIVGIQRSGEVARCAGAGDEVILALRGDHLNEIELEGVLAAKPVPE